MFVCLFWPDRFLYPLQVVDEIVVGLGSEASDSAEEASRTESGKQTRTKKWPKRGDIAAYQRSKPAEEGGVASRASPSVDLASLSAVKNRGASTRRATSRTTPGSRNKQQADSQPVSAQKDESGPAPKTETAAAEPAVNWLRRSAVNSSINPDGRTSVNINTVAPPTNSSTQGDTARAIPPLQPQKQDLVPLPDPKNSAGHTLNQAQPASGTPVTSATCKCCRTTYVGTPLHLPGTNHMTYSHIDSSVVWVGSFIGQGD